MVQQNNTSTSISNVQQKTVFYAKDTMGEFNDWDWLSDQELEAAI